MAQKLKSIKKKTKKIDNSHIVRFYPENVISLSLSNKSFKRVSWRHSFFCF